MNSPVVVFTAEQYVSGHVTFETLLSAIEDAAALGIKRFGVGSNEIAATITECSRETEQAGFTLVELSIVLVIIGLLLGGILAAQSMIATAKVQSFVRQIQHLDVVVNNFKTKYNYYPGDAPAFGGDGDGLVEDIFITQSGHTNVTQLQSELANFWPNLSQAGMLEKIYSNDASSGIRAGVHIPKTQLGKSVAGPGAGVMIAQTIPTLYYIIADYDQGTTPIFWNWPPNGFAKAFTPLETLAIDRKTDDGFALSGAVTAMSVPSGANGNNGLCSSGNTYLSNNNVECFIWMVVGTTIGTQ